MTTALYKDITQAAPPTPAGPLSGGTPGVPGFPGQPFIPAYCVVIPFIPDPHAGWVWHPDPGTDPGTVGSGGWYGPPTFGTPPITLPPAPPPPPSEICYPAQPALPATPAVPGDPGTPAWPAQPGRAPSFNAGWTGGAISAESLTSDGVYEFSVDASVVGVVTGINTRNLGSGYVEIPYAFYLHSGAYSIMEAGVTITLPQPYAASDIFGVVRRGSFVEYFVNYTSVYSSTVPCTGAFFADCSLYFGGDVIR